jgi:hypothetical protein
LKGRKVVIQFFDFFFAFFGRTSNRLLVTFLLPEFRRFNIIFFAFLFEQKKVFFLHVEKSFKKIPVRLQTLNLLLEGLHFF